MGSGIYVATSGAVAQSEAMEVVANNVANASTTGFQGSKVAFGEILAGARAGGRAPQTPASGSYVGVAQVAADAQTGSLIETTNPLDLALVGDGFFVVETARGPRYTRAGNFSLSAEGVLTDLTGNPVRAAGGGTITVPKDAKAVTVERDGTVTADGDDVGVIELVRFLPEGLAREGATLYAALPGANALEGRPEVISGALEASNVNGVRGIVDLIKVSRTYEALLQAIESFRAIDERSARDLGRPK